jgi:hypothetical protein
MTREAQVAATALEVGKVAAPIYADLAHTMKRSDAMLVAVRDAVTLMGVAREVVEGIVP